MLIKVEPTKSDRKFRLSYERRIFALAVLAGLPGTVVALILLWTGSFTSQLQWTLTILIAILWLGLAGEIRQRVVFSLQTLSNILAALREGDYSIRGRKSSTDDALAEVTRLRSDH